MARVSQAKIDLVINDEKATETLKKLAVQYKTLSDARDAAAKIGDFESMKSLDKTLNAIGKEVNQMQREVVDVDQVMRKLNQVPTKDLRAAVAKLSLDMSKLDRNTVEYKDKAEKLAKIQNELALSAGRASDRVQGFWGKLKNTIFTFDLSSAVNGVMNYAKKASDAYAEYDDKLADVQKTTGLAKKSVEELSASLAKINTRSSQNELLGLASQAGKLGLSAKEDVERFTIAADKIGVALGEDLGDKEQAINSIGKLVDLFKLKDQYEFGDAMLKVGSAVNSLGAASTANEGYIVDFLSRTGGIAVSANLSATAIMGLGATFDSLKQPVEASATVMNKLITGMFSKTSEYAKVAKMDLKSFSDLLKNDTNEAMLRVLEGMKGQDLGYTAQMLGEVGENGARAAAAVATIANSTDMVRAQQTLASAEFEKGTSIVDEFNTKNNTAQARREKQQKELIASLVELGRALQPILDLFYSGVITASQALRMLINVISEYKWVVISLTAGVIVYNAQAKIQVALDAVIANWSKVKVFWSKAERVALLERTSAMVADTVVTKRGIATTATFTATQRAMALGQAIVTLNFKAMMLAAKAFFVAIGPVGWVITALTTLGAVLGIVSAKTKEVEASQKGLMEINLRAQGTAVEERIKLEHLLDVAEAKALSDERRKIATEELQKLIPNGINLINQETIANGKAKKAIDDYCESLLLRAKLEAAQQYLVEFEKERLKELSEGATDMSWWQTWASMTYDGMVGVYTGTRHKLSEKFIRENIAAFETESNAVAEGVKKHIIRLQEELDLKNKPKSGGDEVCKKCGKNPCVCKIGSTNDSKWSLEGDEKFVAARVALKRQQLNGELATEEQYSKALLDLEVTTLEARIKTQKEKGKELEKLNEQLLDKQLQQAKSAKSREEQLAKEIQGGDTDLQKTAREYEEKKRALGLHSKEVEQMTASEKAALLQIEKAYAQKVSSINLSTLNKNLDEGKKAMERKLTTLRLAQAEELAGVNTLEQKKALLGRWFSAEQLQAVRTDQEANRLLKSKFAEEQEQLSKQELQSLLSTFQAAADELNAQGGLLDGVVEMTAEDSAKLQDIIDKLREELAKLGQSPVASPNTTSKVDVFGMSVDDWSTLFQNTEGGLTALQKMEVAAKAIGNAFSDVSNLMSAIEARDLKKFEKNQNQKKKSLDKQLKSGQISQETYNAKVQKLDEETDAKREEMERKQAERQKALAVFNALISTAVAVVGALGAQPFGPWNIAMAAVIGALGAIQVAAIIAQPLPGAEEGGLLVERTQDGQRFNAQYDPKRRGAVSSPTVIVGEGGTEYVVPAEGYANPTVRPVLDMIEVARRSGSLGSVNLTALMASNMSGRAAGGSLATQPTPTPVSSASAPWPSDLMDKVVAMLELNEAATAKLLTRLDTPISAEVSVLGRRGIVENLEKYTSAKQRTTIQ